VPTSIPRPCTTPGCPRYQIPGSRKCKEHAALLQQEYDRSRENDPCRHFYSSPEWRSFRASYLKRPGNSRCSVCGREDRTLHLDHVKPIRTAWEQRFDPRNIRLLCVRCHSRGHAKRGERW